MVNHTVGALEDGKKLHRLVRQLLPGMPLSGVYKMLRVGRVRVNGKKAQGDSFVHQGDVLELRMGQEDFDAVRKSVKKFQGVPTDIDVVYEDNGLLVVNKEAGLLTHGAQGEHKDTLANRVLAYMYKNGSLAEGVFTPAPANRLDRNTSGLILFGKTGDMARELAEGFRTHEIRKWYLAVVRGRVREAGSVDAGLVRNFDKNITRVDDESGKQSSTLYEPVAWAANTTLVRLELVSGRTHQIRAHMQHLGHPLIQDRKYGGHTQHDGMSGHAMVRRSASLQSRPGDIESKYWLHAGWVMMQSGRVFHARLPEDFRKALQDLGYTSNQLSNLAAFQPKRSR